MNELDVVIIGSGAAGLYTALCIAELAPNWNIGLVTKDNLATSASDWAQGGIAAVIDHQDSPQFHGQDTLKAGAGLCESTAVQTLVEGAASQIYKLLNLGVEFDRTPDGSLALTLEAAHSHRRVLHSADTTGRALVSKLAAQVRQQPHIQVFPQTLVLDLWVENNQCLGLYYLNPQQELGFLPAPNVVLATGGGAQVFAQNTNPASSTGDGVAIAWRAGAVVRDLEFVQFHPTALAIANAPRFLISEAVRGEGAYLIDHQGDRFSFKYDPRGELAPRDVVSRAIFHHLLITKEPTVFLDLSPIAPQVIAHRFPNIHKICLDWQIDIFAKPIPVTPAAHYCMGGIATDNNGATSIMGLYAVGETSSTGVHGANRLASNSLLECFVFGEKLAQQVVQGSRSKLSDLAGDRSVFQAKFQALTNPQNLSTLHTIKTGIQELTWTAAGISRTHASLTSALDQIKLWQQEIKDLQVPCRLWSETRNLADFSYLVIISALFRTESRGAHYRADYPQPSPDWQVHTVIQNHTIGAQPI